MTMKYHNPDENWYYNQRYDSHSEKALKGCLYSTLLFIIVLSILIAVSSCKSIQYVPVETVKTEYISKTDTFIQKDSVYFQDSVYVIKNGDTITTYKTRYVYKDRWKEVIKTDTVFKTDSIQVPYPVEKKLSRWESLKMTAGGFTLLACFLFVGMIIFTFFWRVHK